MSENKPRLQNKLRTCVFLPRLILGAKISYKRFAATQSKCDSTVTGMSLDLVLSRSPKRTEK